MASPSARRSTATGSGPCATGSTDDGLVVCASEAGVVDLPEGRVRRGKLGPGQMIVVDPRNGGLDDDAIRAVANEEPWAAWAEEHRIARLPEMPRVESLRSDELVTKQILHGYTREDLSMMIRPAAAHGKEPTFSMGDDTPIAALSRHGRSIFNHLRQRFAQVTNPAMDHLRERSVMSLAVLLGPRSPLLVDDPGAAALEEFESFFRWERPSGRRLDATWRAGRGAPGLRAALRRLGSEAVAAAADGEPILVVSDADAGPDRAPIPSVLAVGAVNVALTNAGLRTRCSIVAEADDARESHHVACLLAVGAEAVRLPLAAATVAALSHAAGDDDDGVSTALARLPRGDRGRHPQDAREARHLVRGQLSRRGGRRRPGTRRRDRDGRVSSPRRPCSADWDWTIWPPRSSSDRRSRSVPPSVRSRTRGT